MKQYDAGFVRTMTRKLRTAAMVVSTIATAVMSGLVPVSATAQSIGKEQTIPGRLINIGTHRLHIHCLGQGGPTVVVDMGLGSTELEWLEVQRQVAERRRICLYDRAGNGWSDSGPKPRTSERIVQELHTLLTEANIEPPYTLVGHSFGGYTAQLFASHYPDLVAGLVLVDSSHPDQIARFAAPPVKVNIAPKGILMIPPPAMIPEQLIGSLRTVASGLANAYKMRLTVKDELQNFRASARQVAEADPLPDVPLVVITRGKRLWPDNDRGQRMEKLWQVLQKELVGRCRRAVQMVSVNSGHSIHLDDPAIIAMAIDRLTAVDWEPTESPTLAGLLPELVLH